MTEFIDKQKAIDAVTVRNLHPGIINTLQSRIVAIPAADVRPVVRGLWKDAMQSCHDSPHVKCSVCGGYFWRYFNEFNYCPNCGARMDGGEE